MSAMQTIERLVSFGPRWPGLEGDRRTTDFLARELEAMGRTVELEPIKVRPAYHITLALLAALAVAGNVLSATSSPPLGVVLLLVAAAAIYGDLTTRFLAARWLTSRRTTANVSSPGTRSEARARVILVAHHDAPQSGLLYARRRRGRPTPLSRLAGRLDPLFWATFVSLIVAVVRLVTGSDAGVLTVGQFGLTVALMAFVALLVDSALSGVVPGASSNASGVAAVLEVARRLGRRPPENVDVWIVLTGAKEGFMLGMRQWLDAHDDQLSRDHTYFLNVDTVGNGELHHVTGEGSPLMYRADRRLVRLCESSGSKPHVWRTGTDATIALMRGYPSITLCALDRSGRMPTRHAKSDTPARVEPEAVERASDLVEQVVRRIDAALAPDPATRLPAEARS
jgi:peptidase M28-like protein